jgi:hypothetical protein
LFTAICNGENYGLFQFQRRAIVAGEHEPEDAECDIPLINDMEPEELNVSPIVFMPLASYKSITFHISAY